MAKVERVGTHPAAALKEGSSQARIVHLLGRLRWLAPLIVLGAALAVAATFYWQLVPPLADAGRMARQQQASQRVEQSVRSLLAEPEKVLLTLRDWHRSGLLRPNDADGFNRLLLPLLARYPQINGVLVADDEGREMFLTRVGNSWRNRISDPAQGNRRHWLTWRAAGVLSTDEWREQDYDPRRRPWFTGALAVAPHEVAWTAPYQFFTAQEPGITVSARWQDPISGRQHVLALDVLLLDVARFTSQLSFGRRGQVALLTAGGQLLGPPRDPRFAGDERLRQAVLQTPGALGLRALEALLQRRSESDGDGMVRARIPAEISGDGNEWLGSLQTLTVGRQTLQIATLAPEEDFSVVPGRLKGLVVGLLLAIGVVGVLAALGMVAAARRPITELFDSAEAQRHQIAEQMRRRDLVSAISLRLQQARDPAGLAQELLSALAPQLQLGQGLLCQWDEVAQALWPIGRYGGAGADEYQALASLGGGRSLLDECAARRAPIHLENPPPDYFSVGSALGAAPPSEVLILPLQHGGHLFAVLELAAFRPFSAEDRALLAEIEPIVAMSLDLLLQPSRSLADELSAMQEGQHHGY